MSDSEGYPYSQHAVTQPEPISKGDRSGGGMLEQCDTQVKPIVSKHYPVSIQTISFIITDNRDPGGGQMRGCGLETTKGAETTARVTPVAKKKRIRGCLDRQGRFSGTAGTRNQMQR